MTADLPSPPAGVPALTSDVERLTAAFAAGASVLPEQHCNLYQGPAAPVTRITREQGFV